MYQIVNLKRNVKQINVHKRWDVARVKVGTALS